MNDSEPTQTGRVLLDYDGSIAFVTLAHPGRLNAITVHMWRELERVFNELSQNTGLRCIVLRGQDGNFAAGADIREFPQQRADVDGVINYHMKIIAPALHAIATCLHPVVAQIDGVCVGGGLEIASQCDLRIAGVSSRYGVPINRLGFPMAPEEMRGLLSLAGRAVTLEILLEGRVFGAAEAMAKGLVTRVLPDDEVAGDVLRAARRLSRGAPLAARLNKKTVARLCAGPEQLTDAELRSLFSYATSRDHHEGVRAFLAGEEPAFLGD
jgi:enoyl-CoA hydratase/carnithine racemase